MINIFYNYLYNLELLTLQLKNLDLSTAMTLAINVEQILLKMQSNSDTAFLYIFNNVLKICD
jgi:hypothetical protein